MSKPTEPPPLQSLWGALNAPEPEEEEQEGELRQVRFRGRAYSIFLPAPSPDKALELIGRICKHMLKEPGFKTHLEKFGLFTKAPPQSHLTLDMKGFELYAAASSLHVHSAQTLALDHLASALSSGKEKFPELASILLESQLKVVRH